MSRKYHVIYFINEFFWQDMKNGSDNCDVKKYINRIIFLTMTG